jgi:hypothetical protein
MLKRKRQYTDKKEIKLSSYIRKFIYLYMNLYIFIYTVFIYTFIAKSYMGKGFLIY